MSPLERAARALLDVRRAYANVDPVSDDDWATFFHNPEGEAGQHLRDCVRAVVAAIRSPSAAMVEAGARAIWWTGKHQHIWENAAEQAQERCRREAEAALSAMLDELLKEKADGK